MSRSNSSWWASSTSSARRTTIGASAIALALIAVCYFVWMSPANPIADVRDSVTAAVVDPDTVADMKQERNRLLSRTVELESKMDDKNGQLARLSTQLESTQRKLAEATTVEAAPVVKDNKPPVTRTPAKAPAKSTTPVKAPVKVPAPAVAAPVKEPVVIPTKAEIVNPTSRYLGLYTTQAPFNWATYDEVATKLGNQPSMVGYFSGWDETFRANAVTRAWDRNQLPMLTWESRPIGSPNSQVDEPDYQLPAIIGDPAAGVPGKYDEYIRQYAKDIVATGLPLAIRFDHEMNGVWYPWSETTGKGEPINGNRVGDYVKTWQHVHDIFEQEGANNLVIWTWAPNIVNNLPAANKSVDFLTSLYPGDEYVDWVGVSGYLRPAYKADNDFTFDYTFGATLDQLRQISDKPIVLAEIGASEVGGKKAKWITSVFDALADPKNADIVGLGWFNLAVTSYTEGELATNDWRIESRPESLEAFKEGILRPEDNFNLTPIPTP
ncbi:glycosyl hydrolase [Conyzicola sp.]|uniref:glycosyl hydrolase n=1 Tax=Conyzicola sp. TaxID=1969404 RepID=UPI003989CD17